VLAHEAWLRLSGRDCKSRTHYLALASRAMRHFMIDYTRAKLAQKRAAIRVPLNEGGHAAAAIAQDEVVDIARLLARLAREDPRKARVVEMRFFGGMDLPEIAAELNVSLVTIKRDWQFCRAWLCEALDEAGNDGKSLAT
jgi:RNA polymerase sigma factor (TIGR02999 family)